MFSLEDGVSNVTTTTTINGKIQLPETLMRSNNKKGAGDDNGNNVLPSVLITLNHGEFSTYSTYKEGIFTFPNVPAGVHVLDVHSPKYIFSQIKIQLLPDAMDDPKCIEYVYPGAPKQILASTNKPGETSFISLTAHGTYDYFEPRPTISVLSLLKNPMIIMMLIGALLMMSMPYMMEGLDEEQKEQMKKQMEVQQDPSKMINSLFGVPDANDAAKKAKKLKDKAPRKKRE